MKELIQRRKSLACPVPHCMKDLAGISDQHMSFTPTWHQLDQIYLLVLPVIVGKLANDLDRAARATEEP